MTVDLPVDLRSVDEIDCARETAPERFVDTGDSRVIQSPLGTYREVGDGGYDMTNPDREAPAPVVAQTVADIRAAHPSVRTLASCCVRCQPCQVGQLALQTRQRLLTKRSCTGDNEVSERAKPLQRFQTLACEAARDHQEIQLPHVLQVPQPLVR